MLAIVNSNIPTSAMDVLKHFAEVVPFHTEGITFCPLAGHVDLFATPGSTWVVAPNIPSRYQELLSAHQVPFVVGSTSIGSTIESLGAYNAAVHPQLMVANTAYLDSKVKELHSSSQIVAVRQGMCRCTTLVLDVNHVVTSDAGIAKSLQRQGVGPLLVDSSPILLPGYRSGCFGGCCGVEGDRLFLIGSLSHHPQGEAIRQYVMETHITEIIELYQGPLFDAGSLFFL